jgi:virulence-associated protein VagC
MVENKLSEDLLRAKFRAGDTVIVDREGDTIIIHPAPASALIGENKSE